VRAARVYGLLVRAAAAHHGQPVARNALKVNSRLPPPSPCVGKRVRAAGACRRRASRPARGAQRTQGEQSSSSSLSLCWEVFSGTGRPPSQYRILAASRAPPGGPKPPLEKALGDPYCRFAGSGYELRQCRTNQSAVRIVTHSTMAGTVGPALHLLVVSRSQEPGAVASPTSRGLPRYVRPASYRLPPVQRSKSCES
jgi:hypothetical protein